MNKRETLLNDLIKFDNLINESKSLDNKWSVEKNVFIDFINRINNLTENDFESQQKFDLFSFYNKRTESKIMVSEILDSIVDDKINLNTFLQLGEFIERIKEKLKSNN